MRTLYLPNSYKRSYVDVIQADREIAEVSEAMDEKVDEDLVLLK